MKAKGKSPAKPRGSTLARRWKRDITWPLDELAEVEWVDSSMCRGWAPLKDYESERASPCRTVGYVIFEDDLQIVLMQNQGGKAEGTTAQVSSAMTIPKCALLRRRTLR